MMTATMPPHALTPARLQREIGRGRADESIDTGLVRVVSINTHRGQGPKLRYLLENAPESERERALLLHDTRAYTYHIADWLRQHAERYHVVALQEVFDGLLGGLSRTLRGRRRQVDYYRTLAGFPHTIVHRVGFAAFRYMNVLLCRLPRADGEREMHSHLPGRVLRLAACGFTLAPFLCHGRTVWLGNTHLHAYNPRARARQAVRIAREIRRLGDVPVLFLGDLNTVPVGCRDGDFPHGDRDRRSYVGDRTLAILAAAGLRAVHHADDVGCWTYPTGFANRTLDYVLYTRHWEVEDYRIVPTFTLSDHYPVEATFRLRPPD